MRLFSPTWGKVRRVVVEFDEQSPGSLFRLHLGLSAGSILPAVEQLHVAGQSPRLMIFVKENGTGRMVFDFEKANEAAADVLAYWPKQVPGVASVETEWRKMRQSPTSGQE